MYAFLIFLPIFLFGYANEWPRVWAVFGLINGLALLFFAALGIVAALAALEAAASGGRAGSGGRRSPVAAATEPSEKPLV